MGLLHAAEHEDDDDDCSSTCESATLRLLMSPSFQALFLIVQIVLVDVASPMLHSNHIMRRWVIVAIVYLALLAILGRRRALYLALTMLGAFAVYRVLEVATMSSQQLTDLDAILPWIAFFCTSLGAFLGLQPADHLRYSWKIQVAVAFSLLRSSSVTIVLIRTGDLRILKALLATLVPFWSGLLIMLHWQRATSLARTLTTMRTDLEHARSLDLQEEHQRLLRPPPDSFAPSSSVTAPSAHVSTEPSAASEAAVYPLAPSAHNLAVLVTVGNQQSSSEEPASEGAGPSGASQLVPSGDASDAGSDSTYATLYSSDDLAPSYSNNEFLAMLGPATRARAFQPAFAPNQPPAPRVAEPSLAESVAQSRQEAAARLARVRGPFVWARVRLLLLGSIDPNSPLFGISVDAIQCVTRQYVSDVLQACARVPDAPWSRFIGS